MLSAVYSAAQPVASLVFTLLLVVSPMQARQTQTTAAPPAQDEDEVVRVSAELVQTDVMVFDREGRFVDGLRPEQFELKVDGRPYPIAFFERIEAGTVNEDAQLAAARGGVRRTAQAEGAALPLDRGRTLAFFVDDLHLSPAGAVRARRSLQKFVEEEIGQNDVAVVASSSGHVGFLQQFTDHKGMLRAAVGRIEARGIPVRDLERPPMSQTQALAVQRNDISVINVFVELMLRDNPMLRRESAENSIQQRARIMMTQTNQMASHTLYALEQLIRRSSPLSGRKVLFFISDGFVLDESDMKVRERLRRVADAAARAGVVIYSIDALGLQTNMPDAGQETVSDPGMILTSQAMGDVTAFQSPLFTLASETGGRAIVNTNDAFGPGVKGALKETSKYYLLAWRPEDSGANSNPKFRRVEATVKGRSDLRVIVRRGFYSTPPPEIGSPSASRKERGKEKGAPQSTPEVKSVSAEAHALRAALLSLQPRMDLPTSLWLGYTDTAEAGTVLTASVELARETLTSNASEGEAGRFDILGVLYDVQGKVVGGFKQEVNVPARAGGPERRRLVVTNQTPLASGLYQVRVAARDARTGRTGSATDWIEIPDLKRERMALGSLFVAERTPNRSEQTAAQQPEPSLLCADRRFARTSWLRFITHVYSPAAVARPDLAMQVQVFRDDQPVFTAPLRKVPDENFTDPKRVPYAAELTLSDFPSGRYALQLTAIDRTTKQSATQRITFTIE